jgi:hypothetical protein
LRQVGFAALDHAAAVRTATELLALGPGFGDPLLAELGLADFTAPVGPDTYLEVLAPTTPDHPRRTARRSPSAAGRSGSCPPGAAGPGIVAVDVHATDREHGTRQQGMLCHTMINFT